MREVLTAVGLDADLVTGRLPHEFSGGQCQRISIARALILEPEFVICDEPVSALDVSIRAQILNLLEDMKRRYGLTLLFIAHDLAVVKAVSDRIAVMYLGKLCEVGPTEQLFARPAHPYTALLLEAIPVPDPTVKPAVNIAVGEPPSPLAPPSGCRFRTRCPRADGLCASAVPELREVARRPVRGLPSSAGRRLDLQPAEVVHGDGPAHAAQGPFAEILDFRDALDRRCEPAAGQDLPVAGIGAKPRGEIDDRADRRVVEAVLEADAPERGVALGHADAEAQRVTALGPGRRRAPPPRRASRSPSLAARSAASGQGNGSLKNTIMPSPVKRSSVPSYLRISGPTAP